LSNGVFIRDGSGRMTPSFNAAAAGAFASALTLCACDRAPRPQVQQPAPSGTPSAAPADYVQPPHILAVKRGAAGSMLVEGSAAPDARVRAVQTDGASFGATADHKGRYAVEVPPGKGPKLIALSTEDPTRSVRAQGWLFIPPDAPERAVLLRPGAAARPLAGASLIAAVDYGPGGGLAISGMAGRDAPVAVALDGAAIQETHADGQGIWTLQFASPAPPGAHVLHVRSGAAHADVNVVLASRPARGLFQAGREAADWRIDWTPPGGGAQTTLLILGGGA
jgi:hypothetical protein